MCIYNYISYSTFEQCFAIYIYYTIYIYIASIEESIEYVF